MGGFLHITMNTDIAVRVGFILGFEMNLELVPDGKVVFPMFLGETG